MHKEWIIHHYQGVSYKATKRETLNVLLWKKQIWKKKKKGSYILYNVLKRLNSRKVSDCWGLRWTGKEQRIFRAVKLVCYDTIILDTCQYTLVKTNSETYCKIWKLSDRFINFNKNINAVWAVSGVTTCVKVGSIWLLFYLLPNSAVNVKLL